MYRHAQKSSRPLVANLNEIAITKSPSLPTPSLPTVPSISCSDDRHYFYLKDVDSIVFSATQTVCPFSSKVKPDFMHEDSDPEEIFKLQFILSRYIQVAATPDNSELKYTGTLFQRLATIQRVPSGTSYALSSEQKSS
ncbi:uncharacterized protein F5147DRAFT_782825 [Suillus discolor]|uniref:Uncharacterized protein n=1 Tax=Suillus discolor TaxID=1912936 RepID=A0A9P7ERD0_9AGAM|nr:uncharacterized protein F5147DRAFT_782825 [Suillus discolor]KAG2083675.1 hypothetical protein F5147DRAFT_782825 [Suillus discolor]